MSAPRITNSSRTPISERIKIFGGGADKVRPAPSSKPATPDPAGIIQRPVLKPTPSVNANLGAITVPTAAAGTGRSQFSAKDPTKGLKKSPNGSVASSRSDLSRTPSNASTKSSDRTPTSTSKSTVSRTGSIGKNSPSPTKKYMNNGGSSIGSPTAKKLPVSRKLSDKLAESNNNNTTPSKLPQVKESTLPKTTPPAIEEKTPPRRISAAEENNTIDTIILGTNTSAVINFTDKTLEINDISPPTHNSTVMDNYINNDTVDRSSGIRKLSTDIMFSEQTYQSRKLSSASVKSDISSVSNGSVFAAEIKNGYVGGGITVNGKTDSESFFTRQAMNNATAESFSKVNNTSKVF